MFKSLIYLLKILLRAPLRWRGLSRVIHLIYVVSFLMASAIISVDVYTRPKNLVAVIASAPQKDESLKYQVMSAEERIGELERRMNDVDAEHIDRRLTIIETKQDSNNNMLTGISIFLGLLVIKQGLQMLGIPQKNNRHTE